MPVEVTIDRTRQVLGAQGPRSFIAGFDYSVLPYSGCALACRYCYVPDVINKGGATAELARTWGRWVKARPLTPDVIRRRAAGLAGKALFMSATTDPYQPLERQHGITRGVLEALAGTGFRRLLISTRNPLLAFERDLDLLVSPELRWRVEFGVSITTDEPAVRAIFERTNPPAEVRRDAARSLAAAGVHVRLHVAPLLPNSGVATFAAWLQETGARYIWLDDLNHASPELRTLFAKHGFGTWLDQPGQPGEQTAQLQALLTILAAQGVAADWGSTGFVKGWDPRRQALVDAATWGTPLTGTEGQHGPQ
jgi:DNA repair photolyase